MARRPKRTLVDELSQDLQIARGLTEAIRGLAAKHSDISALNVAPVLDVGIRQLDAKRVAAVLPDTTT